MLRVEKLHLSVFAPGPFGLPSFHLVLGHGKIPVKDSDPDRELYNESTPVIVIYSFGPGKVEKNEKGESQSCNKAEGY